MAKPTTIPRFAQLADGTPAANIEEPTDGQKDTGWEVNQIPPSSVFNWMHRWCTQWIRYLDGLAGEALTWTARQTFSGGATVPAPAAGTDATTKIYVDAGDTAEASARAAAITSEASTRASADTAEAAARASADTAEASARVAGDASTLAAAEAYADALFASAPSAAWTALTAASGWTSGSGNQALAYMIRAGVVYLRGNAVRGSTAETLTTLPAGARPLAARKIICAGTGTPDAVLVLTIAANGVITVSAADTITAWLDGVSFVAEQ